jgi:hypothetical protein
MALSQKSSDGTATFLIAINLNESSSGSAPSREVPPGLALRKFVGTRKRILLKKCRKLRPQGQALPPGAWSILTG